VACFKVDPIVGVESPTKDASLLSEIADLGSPNFCKSEAERSLSKMAFSDLGTVTGSKLEVELSTKSLQYELHLFLVKILYKLS